MVRVADIAGLGVVGEVHGDRGAEVAWVAVEASAVVAVWVEVWVEAAWGAEVAEAAAEAAVARDSDERDFPEDEESPSVPIPTIASVASAHGACLWRLPLGGRHAQSTELAQPCDCEPARGSRCAHG